MHNFKNYIRPSTIASYIKILIGLPAPLKSPDRSFLENKVFSYLNSISNFKGNLLFAGVASYTKHYYAKLKYQTYTIDWERSQARYGNGPNHVVGSVTELNKFWPDGYFDVIVANGLIGYGINSSELISSMLENMHDALRENGLLIIGYNDNHHHLQRSLTDFEDILCFTRFTPNIDGVDRFEYLANKCNDHKFVFLKKCKN